MCESSFMNQMEFDKSGTINYRFNSSVCCRLLDCIRNAAFEARTAESISKDKDKQSFPMCLLHDVNVYVACCLWVLIFVVLLLYLSSVCHLILVRCRRQAPRRRNGLRLSESRRPPLSIWKLCRPPNY